MDSRGSPRKSFWSLNVSLFFFSSWSLSLQFASPNISSSINSNWVLLLRDRVQRSRSTIITVIIPSSTCTFLFSSSWVELPRSWSSHHVGKVHRRTIISAVVVGIVDEAVKLGDGPASSLTSSSLGGSLSIFSHTLYRLIELPPSPPLYPLLSRQLLK